MNVLILCLEALYNRSHVTNQQGIEIASLQLTFKAQQEYAFSFDMTQLLQHYLPHLSVEDLGDWPSVLQDHYEILEQIDLKASEERKRSLALPTSTRRR